MLLLILTNTNAQIDPKHVPPSYPCFFVLLTIVDHSWPFLTFINHYPISTIVDAMVHWTWLIINHITSIDVYWYNGPCHWYHDYCCCMLLLPIDSDQAFEAIAPARFSSSASATLTWLSGLKRSTLRGMKPRVDGWVGYRGCIHRYMYCTT